MSDRRGGQRSSNVKRDDRGGDRYRSNDRSSAPNSANRSVSNRRRSPEPTIRIPDKAPQNFTLEIPKKKFTGRCRLFVGNLANDIKEEELKKMFAEFGEISECYSSGKGFAFLRLDTRAHAEAAKETMDGKTVKGRQLRVRFAVHGAALHVSELSSCVSNEMLYHTFSVFGDVERAVHIVDERGKPTGEGIVEFERKTSAQEALKNIEERVFVMTNQSHPLRAEILEPKDDEDGLAERMISRTPQTLKEREVAPHFADNKSFEFVYGQRWKELYKHEKERRAQVEEELKQKRRQLEQDMEIEYEDYRAQMIREDLERQRKELERLEAARRDRQTKIGPTGYFGNNSPIIDGPHGRPPPTYGRDPSHGPGGHDRGAPPPLGPDSMEMKRILSHFNASEPHIRPPPVMDPHAIGVQRSLNQSLGLGEPLLPPPNMGMPPGMNHGYAGPPQFFGGPQNPPSLMHNLIGPPQDYRPDIKRQRR